MTNLTAVGLLKILILKKTFNIKKLSMLLFKQWLEKVSLYDTTIDLSFSIT